MSTHFRTLPKDPHDLTLAPVAISIDRNLAIFRDVELPRMDFAIQLELDRPERAHTPEERASRVLEAALRNVDLHGWNAQVTPDHARIRLSGGSVTLDLGLSAAILRFINGMD
jgi:hypothetical protein